MITTGQNAATVEIVKPNRHILTVSVEDYFQGKAFIELIDRRQWSRFETRVERDTLAALDLLDKHDVRATFFFMNWVAEHHPGLVREVARRGHEIASSGDSKLSFRTISRLEFSDDIQRSRDLLETAAGVRVRGFRAADHQLEAEDLWALKVLASHGYDYDSSINPSLFSFRREPWRRFVHQERWEDGSLWEVPLSSLSTCGVQIPVAGGNWFRQLPESFVQHAVNRWSTKYSAPFVMYFRSWDLDPDQPVITGASRLSRLRHYRNSEKVRRMIETFLSEYKFSSIANYLQLKPETVATHTATTLPPTPVLRIAASAETRTPVTVVIPCYNEESALPYLANTLRDLRKTLDRYEVHFVFVDDGSKDKTVEVLRKLFGHWTGCEILEHPQNSGVAAAILTGIRHAGTEIVCSMDCDCTYDPHELAKMIPMLAPGTDLVTASPYHPDGRVLRVPAWRLGLSKCASLLYRCVVRQSLFTYTSCFRVYRRSAVLPIHPQEGGFLGVAEMVALLDQNGSRIAEYPATLQVRMLGHSKMRVMKTIAGHIRLMTRFGLARLLRRTEKRSSDTSKFSSTLYASKGMDRE